jgi:hypothetical protein
MTKEEYQKELQVLTQNFNKARLELSKKYAIANCPYKVGDVFCDHIGAITIQSITIKTSIYSDFPEVVFHGVELRKDGSLNKKR